MWNESTKTDISQAQPINDVTPMKKKIWVVMSSWFRFGFWMYRYALHRNLLFLSNYPERLELNVPIEYWNVTSFRATLGHKVNHSFTKAKSSYKPVIHPRYGLIRWVFIALIGRSKRNSVAFFYVCAKTARCFKVTWEPLRVLFDFPYALLLWFSSKDESHFWSNDRNPDFFV